MHRVSPDIRSFNLLKISLDKIGLYVKLVRYIEFLNTKNKSNLQDKLYTLLVFLYRSFFIMILCALQNTKRLFLRGYCTSYPKLACFVLYLKIINTLFGKIYASYSKLSKELKITTMSIMKIKVAKQFSSY